MARDPGRHNGRMAPPGAAEAHLRREPAGVSRRLGDRASTRRATDTERILIVPFPARRSAVLGLLVVAVLVLAGCSRVTGPRQWISTAQLTGGGTQTIDVRDTSGRIDNLEIDPTGVNTVEGVSNPQGQPNVVVVSWTGGACDTRTDVAIAAVGGQGLGITISRRVAPGACDAIGVGHVLRITSGQPLPAGAINVNTEPPTAG